MCGGRTGLYGHLKKSGLKQIFELENNMNHLKLEIKDKIAVLEWSQPNSSVNLICHAFIKELSLIIKELDPSQTKALVFLSKKEKGFSAGADIKEIKSLKSKEELAAKIDQVNELFLKFESLNILKIVAIDGDCLGGGLEWALCFDIILASNCISTKLGLPEVKLGLIPCFGACFRLPRRTGLIKSLKMIGSGRSLNGKQAFQSGLADELVPKLLLKKRALDLAQDPPSLETGNKYRLKKPFLYWRDTVFNSLICFVFKLKIKDKTKGFYPAPLSAAQLVNKAQGTSLSYRWLKLQKKLFIDLALNQTAKNLIALFEQSQQAKKTLSLLKADCDRFNKKDRPIQKIGVLGAGVMGSSIACLLADKGFEVRLMDNQAIALRQVLKKWENILQKQSQQKTIDSYQENRKKNLLSVSQNFWGLKQKDLIIECLPEDLKLKQELIGEVSKKIRPDCLFVSNSSSLSIQELSQACQRPERFFGLHFFNPAEKMPLVEICIKESQKEYLSALPDLIQKIGKIPLMVQDSPCFVVNRVLLSYLLECLLLLEKGYAAEEMDDLLKEKGFPLGPFETMDKVGLDICVQTVLNLKKKEPSLKTPHFLEDLTKILGRGEKERRGFYLYSDKKQINPKTEVLKKGELSVQDNQEKLFQKILNQMAQTGKNLIQKKIATSDESLDMAMVLGSGFPAFMGGPVKMSKDK